MVFIMNLSDIIVVEGKNDKAKILEIYPDANVIITNGSEISKDTIKMLVELSKNHNIILFLDPDYPGERIRSIITNNIPNASQAFIKKKLAIDERKHKVGVEHASKEYIKEALDNLLSSNNIKGTLTSKDMYDLALAGSENSKELRCYLADVLSIGNPNAKTLLKRLNILNIKKDEVERILNEKNRNN